MNYEPMADDELEFDDLILMINRLEDKIVEILKRVEFLERQAKLSRNLDKSED